MRLRRSHQREVILGELQSVSTHPTASELYEAVRSRLPNISLGTIYRNLELLTRHGMIRKLDNINGQARFDGNPHPHHHVRCIHCGRVDDVPQSPFELEMGKIKYLSGQEILGLRMEFVGICSTCGADMPVEEQSRYRREWKTEY